MIGNYIAKQLGKAKTKKEKHLHGKVYNCSIFKHEVVNMNSVTEQTTASQQELEISKEELTKIKAELEEARNQRDEGAER